MSQSAFSKKVDRSRQYINKLVKNGTIPGYGDKKEVKYSEASQILEDMKDPTRDAQREANAERRQSPSLMDVSGSYDSVADMTDAEKVEQQKLQEKLKEKQREAESLSADTENIDIEKLNISQLNAAILRQELRIRTAKADDSENAVISIEEVERKMYEAGRIMRDTISGFAARLSAVSAAESDPHKSFMLLKAEENRMLKVINQELSNEC